MEQARIHREEQALCREQQLMNEREALERRKEAFEEEKKRRLDHKVTGVTYQTVGENLVSEKSEIPREIIEHSRSSKRNRAGERKSMKRSRKNPLIF